MSKVDRQKPKRSTASESRYTLFEFKHDFPDDDACLTYLYERRFSGGVFCPTHKKVTTHYRQAGQPSWVCSCGHKVHPTAGTIFENSATSLRLWFYAMYLMASTRCGISAKQLERELGVTYKTAWRMFRQIRSLLPQAGTPLGGVVESDEAFIGGRARWKNMAARSAKVPALSTRPRFTEWCSVAKDRAPSRAHALPGSIVYTDTWMAYTRLGRLGYKHSRIPHDEHVYVRGGVHTNTIEGFWSLLRRGISGVYHGVSTKHLRSYVDEYVFCCNHKGEDMFAAFMGRVLRDAAMRDASA